MVPKVWKIYVFSMSRVHFFFCWGDCILSRTTHVGTPYQRHLLCCKIARKWSNGYLQITKNVLAYLCHCKAPLYLKVRKKNLSSVPLSRASVDDKKNSRIF
jgi:hypothetical protein